MDADTGTWLTKESCSQVVAVAVAVVVVIMMT